MLRKVAVKQLLTVCGVILVQPHDFGRAPGVLFHSYYVSSGASSSCLRPLLDGAVCFDGVTSFSYQSTLDAKSSEDTLHCGLAGNTISV